MSWCCWDSLNVHWRWKLNTDSWSNSSGLVASHQNKKVRQISIITSIRVISQRARSIGIIEFHCLTEIISTNKLRGLQKVLNFVYLVDVIFYMKTPDVKPKTTRSRCDCATTVLQPPTLIAFKYFYVNIYIGSHHASLSKYNESHCGRLCIS